MAVKFGAKSPWPIRAESSKRFSRKARSYFFASAPDCPRGWLSSLSRPLVGFASCVPQASGAQPGIPGCAGGEVRARATFVEAESKALSDPHSI